MSDGEMLWRIAKPMDATEKDLYPMKKSVADRTIENERVLYQTGLHPVAYIGPIIGLCIAGLIAVGGGPTVLVLLIGVLALNKLITRRALRITVTDKTVSLGQRWANRSILRRQVEAIDVSLAWAADYGTVVIHGSGGTPIPVKWVPRPTQFRLAVLTELEVVNMALLEQQLVGVRQLGASHQLQDPQQ
jgi:hypothetical protein